MPTTDRARFVLDPEVTFLNHGSFGACPREVLDAQAALQRELEREPVRFFVRELGPRLDAAREEIARFVQSAPEHLVFVRNATEGVAAVLGSLRFEEGDELLTTDHVYGACRNALERVAARHGARLVIANVPFPLGDPSEVLDAIEAAVTPRTRLALLDHVTSPTGLVFPLEAIVSRLEGRGVRVLVDGAHGPGMLPLALDALGASYYAGNLHKWCCAPKGAGILHVRPDRQSEIHPAITSHGMKSRRDRPLLWEEFDWTGTDDPSAWLTAPLAIRTVGAMRAGGWPEIWKETHDKAVRTQRTLANALEVPVPAPASMLGALVAVPLPRGHGPAPRSAWDVDPLYERLEAVHRIQVPIVGWPAPPSRLVRVACALYVGDDDVACLAHALREELALER
ncbi:MAG: aminotransferase class V-fold PLP-dependent enzyme [Sandaracinaceae bacterium]|nr:aminotransferase class V-fold PLP-dependent enzyme [Sandaracinaceae bacterium]